MVSYFLLYRYLLILLCYIQVAIIFFLKILVIYLNFCNYQLQFCDSLWRCDEFQLKILIGSYNSS